MKSLIKQTLVFWGILALITVGSRSLFSEGETKPKSKKEAAGKEVARESKVKKESEKTTSKKTESSETSVPAAEKTEPVPAEKAEAPQKKMIPVSVPVKRDSRDVEKVIQTLNETLDENRKLRSELTKTQDDFDRQNSKVTVLVAQVKELQDEIEKGKDESKAKDASLVKDREALQKERETLGKEKEKFEDVKKEVKKESQVVEDENTKLRSVLNKSILESERDQFVMLLKKAESSSERAAGELARSKVQTERIKHELAEQYYDLGNLLVEKQDYKGALTKYRKALKLNPNDSWTHHNLAVLYDFYFNDRMHAIYHYKKYLKLKPIAEEAGKIRERVMEMELGKMITPGLPIKLDFDQYQKDLKDVK